MFGGTFNGIVLDGALEEAGEFGETFDEQVPFGGLGGGFDRVESNLRGGVRFLEATEQGVVKEGVELVDERFFGTEIGAEGAAVGGLCAGGEVCLDVGTAEAIDGLFGVADHNQAVLLGLCGWVGGALSGEEFLENGELTLVGILKFIDEGGAVALAEDFGKIGLEAQGTFEACDHVVEGEEASGIFMGL